MRILGVISESPMAISPGEIPEGHARAGIEFARSSSAFFCHVSRDLTAACLAAWA
jgi:hypothetical protein